MKNHYLKVLTHVTSLALLLFIFSFSLSLNAQTEFMTTWKTDNLATSNETLRIKEESTHNDLFASAGYFGVDESYLVSPLKRNEPLQLEINHSTSSIFALTGCTSSFSINVASSTCGAVVTYTGPTSNIGSQHAHRTTGLPSGATFPIGVTTITFEEHDSGHTPTGSICTFTITVVDNEKPTASNPADINVQCLGDVPAADITVVTDEADNCGTPSVAFVSQTADPAINNGTITRTYSVTDTNGNSINVYQDIVILDNTDPTASNPADINVQCLSDVPAADITVVNDEADNCGTPTVAFVNQTADPAINNGTITRTYSVTDTNGNSINVYQDIVILDNTDPTASNPADINVQCLSDVPAADITVVNDEADNCGTPTVAFVNQTADPAINNGTITRTYSVTDASGNSINVYQDIVILDNTTPTASNPADINVQCLSDVPAADITVVTDEADNCGTPTVAFVSQTADPAINNGTITRTYSVTDASGNSINVYQDIVILDNTAPTASNPADINVQCLGDVPAADIIVVNDEADNCGTPTVAFVSQTADPAINNGTITRTYSVTDASGNSINVYQDIVILDNTAPTASNPADINVQCLSDVPAADITLVNDEADNCGTPTVAFVSQTADPANNNGTITRTYSVTDASGNSINVYQDIVILDNTAPTASNPADINVQCLGDVPTADITVVTDEADNCGTPTVAFVSQTADPAINNGTITRTYSVTDASGNSINVYQDIVILDNTDPTASNPADINVQCLGDVPTADITVVTDEADNCGTPTVAFVSQTTDPAINNGTITRTYSVTDASGNSINVYQDIVILDNTDPTASNPADINVQCLGDVPAADITVVNDEADNCGTPTVAFVSQTADPAINNGTITRTYSVTDASGNSINVYQNIVILDNNAPITPTLATLNGQCSVTATVPTTTDACAGTITGTTSDPLTYNVQGTYTIVWNFDDGNGNHINVNQTVNVEDTIDPITPTLATLNGQCSVTATAPTTTDACAGTIIGTTSDPSTYNAQGTYTIVWNFDDGNGNDINVNQTVVVDDTIAPTPNTVTLSNITAQCSVTSLTAPTATDNCSGVIAGSHNATLPITVQGTTVITWTYDDGNGNTFTQTQNVIITDTTPPVVVCQNISITLDAGGNATINATDIDNGSTDNCAIASMSLNKYNFNCDDLGTNTVTLTVYDVYGNTDTCTATVTVLDPASSASVTIASNDIDLNDEICLGDNLTFTVTPLNAGTTQYYEWFINGVSEGTTAVPTFTPAFVPTTDYTIYAEMTTDLSACDPKVSNTISIIVHPLPIVSVSSYDICIDDNSQITIPSTGGTWVSNNLSVATINSTSGAITPVSTGTVTFTFTDSITGCENTTNTVTINPLPVISNYPIDNEICENETHTLSPSTGGTWTSSDPTIATITNSGLVTGVSVGINVSFTYTDSSTGCSSTSAPFTVLEIPEITAVEAFPNTICSGEDTVVSVSVAGAGTAEVVIVNYDFNSGNNYGQLNGQEAPNINSFVSSNISFDRTQQGRNASAIPPYFAINDRKQGLRQNDDWRDGSQDWFNNPGGSDDDGDWIFNINGSDLPNYQNFEIYFDAKRQDPGGNNKRVRVEYSTDNGTSWSFAGDRLLPSGTTSWSRYSSTLPGVTNPSNLQIRLNVNDGSTYSYSFWSGYDDQTNPHVVIDNFQVKASTLLTTGIGYNWSVLSGDFSSLPADTDLSQITVTPSVTTEYQVEVTNSDDCPAFETVTVNVNPSPEITFTTNYCPSAPHNNEVEITAISSMPGTTFEWIITYPSPGDSNYDHGGHSNTSATAYVDTAGSYQVIATGPAPNYCVTSAFVEIANELVTNGDFELGNTGFSSDYNYKEDLPGLVPAGQGELYNDSGNNGYSITTNGQNVHDNFWGYDHTTGSGNFMAVNGHGSSLVVWSQDIIVEPNTAYYFSAWGMSMNWQNNTNNRAQLTFNVDGTNLGTAPILPNRSNNNAPGADNWQRFYGDWTSPNWPGPQTITIEIRNLNWRTSGNDFGIDDISFSSLDPFILLVSPPETINDQIICQGNEIDDILYSAGGGSTGADIQWQLDGSNLGTGPFPNNTNPTGIVTTFDGSRYTISGTPTVPGNYTFTVYTTGSCGTPKTSSGEFVVNEAPIVLITTLPQTICQSENSLVLSAILDGSATLGTWSTSGTGSFSGVSGNGINATYNFGTNETGTVTLTFTSNDPDGTGSNGPCDVAEVTIDIEITPYFEATTGSNITTSGCDDNTVTLTGNNVTGQWSVTSGQTADSYFFSDITAHNSTFTGESGETYTLQWSATNTGVCSPNTIATMKVIIPDCGASLVFDGGDDYINFGDNYNLNNTDFSIEAWIKVNTTTGTKTIFSKRDGTSTASGYDLSLIGDRLQFRYNGNTNVVSTQPINSDKWYHAAVTFDGSTYILYIDGFEVRTRAGTTPTTNANKALIGAMDRTGDSPINYFDGKIDEVRIWDTQLSQTQIREMMNQEIKQDGSNVMGEVIPLEITGNLQWNSLIGYYQMNTGSDGNNVAAGIIDDISTASPNSGKLNAMTLIQVEDAPIPYVSRLDDSWDNETTWSASAVQQIPNSKEDNIVPNDLQTWNIVRTATNVAANRSASSPQLGKTTLLGLLVDNNTLSIQSDQPLQVNKYLKIDGTLDLEGESQLLQPTGSIVDYSGTGKLERDQQGTSNEFNYNYWGSPVSNAGSTTNRTYALASILYDGTNPVSWTTNNDAPGTSPATISSRWLYTYANLTGAYADWNHINQNTGISVGLGFTMKGSGIGTSEQNYTFSGQPNNGTITHTITRGNETLLGNPYPSAIDAHTFIDDNEAALLDGSALIFWEQAPNNPSHILSEYLGRYSYLTKTGGVPATTPVEIGGDGGGTASKIPGRYIPVGQGFFVEADGDGGTLVFNNAQRIFKKEGSQSIFLRSSNDNEDYVNIPNDEESVIRRLRFNFTTPEGAVRHLLLGFTTDNVATDGVDYGYDALNADDFPSDLSFLIEGQNYVIQGVGEFDETKVYPLEMVVGETGNIEIGLTELENFDDAIDVYIFDAVEGTYTRFNDVNFQINLETGTYSDRFFLVFQEDETLSTIKDEFKDITVRYLHDTDEIYVKTPPSVEVKQLYLINVAGQTVAAWNATNLPMSNDIKIAVKQISEGAYIIKAETNTGTFNKKIIIKY